eukprot:6212378-Pleurochrysis_carterae.AAC.2
MRKSAPLGEHARTRRACERARCHTNARRMPSLTQNCMCAFECAAYLHTRMTFVNKLALHAGRHFRAHMRLRADV